MIFTHHDGMPVAVGDFIEVESLNGEVWKCIITKVHRDTTFEVVRWRWWHEVMWWNPCNPIELVTSCE